MATKVKKQAGKAAKKQAMENYSPATQKGYVYSKEEMKEGRKKAYLAEQAKKDAKAKKDALVRADMKKAKVDQAKAEAAKKAKQQKKDDITEMDMDQAKIKSYKKANPDKDVSMAKMYEGDMHSYEQMDSRNADATAGESMAPKYDNPIKYFKQKIKYNNSAKDIAIRVAADEKDKKHSSEAGKKRLDKDISSMISHASMAHKHGAMKGDQSASHIDYANYKGTDKGYHGTTGSSHRDQSATHRDYEGGKKKGDGSILTKHFKNR